MHPALVRIQNVKVVDCFEGRGGGLVLVLFDTGSAP